MPTNVLKNTLLQRLVAVTAAGAAVASYAAAPSARGVGQISSQQVPTERLSDVPCVDGFADVFPCDGYDLLSFIPKSEFGVEASAIAGLSETWGWIDPDDGTEYVIQGASNGVHFLRLTDPTDPEYLGFMPNTAGAQLIWYDMKVNDNFLYTVSESAPHNVRAFDLHELRGASGRNNVFVDGGRYLPNVSAHNIIINDETDRAFVVGGNVGLVASVPDPFASCSGGLIILDLSIAALPQQEGCWDGDAYIHDSQCVVYRGPDTEHFEQEICLNSNEDSFSIIDVTDASDITRLGLIDYSDVAYTHQGWISEDHTLFFLGDELDEQDFGLNTRTIIYDITDLDNPVLAGEYVHDNTSIDHNMYIKDGLLTQSNYTSGMRAFTIENAREGKLTPAGFFDIFPDSDAAVFAGTWGHYPYFDSGVIAISSTDEGMAIVRRSEPAVFPVSEPEPAPAPAPEPTPAPLPATGGGAVLVGGALLALARGLRRNA